MAIAVIFTVAFGLLAAVYIMRPEWLGLPSELSADSVQQQPTTISLEVPAYKLLVKERDSLKKTLAKTTDTANKYQANYKAAIQDVSDLQQRLSVQDQEYMRKMDSLEKFNWRLFAKIYDKAEPKEVAEILSELDERDAAFILKSMKPKVAAKVLENIAPETAAAIMALSRTQRLQ
jgi:flagellar motility protein MotE (MotC chaperone)